MSGSFFSIAGNTLLQTFRKDFFTLKKFWQDVVTHRAQRHIMRLGSGIEAASPRYGDPDAGYYIQPKECLIYELWMRR